MLKMTVIKNSELPGPEKLKRPDLAISTIIKGQFFFKNLLK